MSGERLQNVLSHVAEVQSHSNENLTIQYLLMVEIPASEISKRLEHVIRKTVQVLLFIELVSIICIHSRQHLYKTFIHVIKTYRNMTPNI